MSDYPFSSIPLVKFKHRNNNRIKLNDEIELISYEKWDGSLNSKRFDVEINERVLECFSTVKSHKFLNVFLSSGANRKGEVRTIFERVSWHKWFDGICINIDDPTRKWHSPDITVGWYFGDSKVHALDNILDIVKKIINYYKIDPGNVNFIGSSSGGFSALWLATRLEYSSAYAGSPQFFVANWPSSKFFSNTGIDLKDYKDRIIVGDLNKKSRYNIVFNFESKSDIKGQLTPFLTVNNITSVDYGLNVFDNVKILCRSFSNIAVSPHVEFENVAEFILFKNFVDCKSISIADSIILLNALYELNFDRQLSRDKIFAEQAWTILLSKKLFIKNLDIVEKIKFNRYKFSIKGPGENICLEIEWGYKAKLAKLLISASDSTILSLSGILNNSYSLKESVIFYENIRKPELFLILKKIVDFKIGVKS